MWGMNGAALPNALAVQMPGVASALESVGINFPMGGGSDFVRMYAWIAVSLAIVLFAPNTQEIMAQFRPGIGAKPVSLKRWPQWKPTLRWAIASALLAGCGVLSLHRVSEFLYYQF
jgi:hypothetical protein